jgi:hypothetical protein
MLLLLPLPLPPLMHRQGSPAFLCNDDGANASDDSNDQKDDNKNGNKDNDDNGCKDDNAMMTVT